MRRGFGESGGVSELNALRERETISHLIEPVSLDLNIAHGVLKRWQIVCQFLLRLQVGESSFNMAHLIGDLMHYFHFDEVSIYFSNKRTLTCCFVVSA